MKQKILFIATVNIHIQAFHLPYLDMMQREKWETHVATGEKGNIPYCDKKHTISMSRNPFKLGNLRAVKELTAILKKEQFDIIHCHTPVGGAIARLAAKKYNQKSAKKTRVIYTAHGFHFYKGAPLLNWILFYPVEKYLAKYTDTLITINQEDYDRAKKKFGKRCKNIEYVPGVGVDPKKFDFKMTKEEKHKLRKSLDLEDDDYAMIFPARLDKNKNQGFLIKVMKKLKDHPEIHLLLPGKDELDGKYQKLAKNLGVEKNVHFLGPRDDIPQLLKISNLAVSSSKREGLPVNIIEAKMTNLPIVALKCRGMTDLLQNKKQEIIITNNNTDAFKKAILEIKKNKTEYTNTGIEKYQFSTVSKTIKKVVNNL